MKNGSLLVVYKSNRTEDHKEVHPYPNTNFSYYLNS